MSKATGRKKAAKKTTRRPVMTKAAVDRILENVRQGLRHEQAALAAGVSPATARKHKERNPDYAEAIARAEAEKQLELIKKVDAGGKGWQSGAWHLERRWPEIWARAEIRAQIGASAIDEKSLSRAIHEGLAALAKRHADFAAKDVDHQDAEGDA